MPFFDVQSALNYPGVRESFTLHDITSTMANDRGDTGTVTTDYTIYGSVQIVSAEEQDVKEGRLRVGDLLIFVSDREMYCAYLTQDDTITFDSVVYRLVDVIKNPGHYECVARRY